MEKYLKKFFRSPSKKIEVEEADFVPSYLTYGVSKSEKTREITEVKNYESQAEDEQLLLIEKALEEIEEELNERELKHSNYKSIRVKNEKLINTYKPSHINLYKNQDINEIRRRNKPFIDPLFPCNINAILEPNTQQDMINHLCTQFQVYNKFNYSELNSKIKWKRPQAICYDIRLNRHEFVMDSRGRGLGNQFSQNDFVKCLSSDDIFQGSCGDCFMIATFLSICSNKELMGHLVPWDNALRNNMKIGAFHFRLWKLGEWYDVVVDDYLAIDAQHLPLFTKNMQCRNEFWICLFEKCVAKFVGKYEHLNGGFTESISMVFSGGIQNIYMGEVLKHVTYGSQITNPFANQLATALREQLGSVQNGSPTIDELFIIFQYALKTKNLIGCHSNLDICTQYGIIKTHQYAVTSAFVLNNMKIVRVQNPHNQPEGIKNTHHYQHFEQTLVKLGAPKTYVGEIYMQYSDFINCFDMICVYNLLPEKPIQQLSQQLKSLKYKCNLFTQWKILHMRGQMSGMQQGAQFRVNFEVKTSAKEHMMLTICQNYSRLGFQTRLHLFKNMQQIGSYTFYSHVSQQVYYVFLDSGNYTGIFEAFTEIKQSPDVCARIFYRPSNNTSVRFISANQGH
ncbi:unnamed protein product [Brachionus calyciflorus]|uniref:Calpain catalytic domain-containing protein n=1 Tax=Brachionus calyciflorus TaxID=104777 RepID=A0A813UDM2_9BILA|nr:unnamed protein product [Brachionus calyciflorus]